jgi:mono/diheme cytochrome c family protein
MNSRMRPVFAVAILVVASLSAAPVWAGGDAAAGRKISKTHCARCHVIGDFNPMGGIGSTPSFQLLAKRGDWRERFETFFERRPHPVFVRVPDVARWTELPSHVTEFEVTPANIDDIVAFVETLMPK